MGEKSQPKMSLCSSQCGDGGRLGRDGEECKCEYGGKLLCSQMGEKSDNLSCLMDVSACI